jgi:hypothetical protein
MPINVRRHLAATLAHRAAQVLFARQVFPPASILFFWATTP